MKKTKLYLLNKQKAKDIISKLRKLRISRKVTQMHLAESFGVNQTLISQFELGKVDSATLLVCYISYFRAYDLYLIG